jgi:hypothetical protein
MPVPNDELSPHAQGMMPNPEKQKKADALKEKIAVYEAEIARLKALQSTADKARYKLEQERAKYTASMDEKLLKYFSYIEKNCSEYLASCNEARRFLLRGQDDATQKVFIAHPRADREPKDSSKDAQKKIDAALSAYGFKAQRGNSIFTSSDVHQASNYGSVFAIFPKNGFSFTWSPKHDDLVVSDLSDFIDVDDEEDTIELYSDLDDDLSQLKYIIEDGIEDYAYYCLSINSTNKKCDEIKKLFKVAEKDPQYKIFYKAMSLWLKLDPYSSKTTIKTVQEAFIKVIAAYNGAKQVFPPLEKAIGAPHMKTILKNIAGYQKNLGAPAGGSGNDELNKKIIDGFGFTNKNLTAAIKSQHEVCVLGEYIAVNWDDYKKDIEKYFLDPKSKASKSKPIGPKGKAKHSGKIIPKGSEETEDEDFDD